MLITAFLELEGKCAAELYGTFRIRKICQMLDWRKDVAAVGLADFLVEAQDFDERRPIGRGSFHDKQTNRGIDKRTGKSVAIKHIRDALLGDEDAYGAGLRQLQVMTAVSHPSVSRLTGFYVTGSASDGPLSLQTPSLVLMCRTAVCKI